MDMFVALIALVFFGILVVGGIIINMYMYTGGALRGKELRQAQNTGDLFIEPDTLAEAQFYARAGETLNQVSVSPRRILWLVFCSIVVLSLLCAFVLNIR